MFAAVCVLLAAVGHVLMSGTGVPWWALSGALAGTGAVAWALAGRERGPLSVITATVAVQAALHSAFSLAQSVRHPALPSGGLVPQPLPDTAMAAVPDAAAHAHHAHHSMHGMSDMSMSGTSSAGMLAAHLLAALLCGLWLAYGEQSAFRVLRALAGWLWTPLRLLFGLAPAPLAPRVRLRRERRSRVFPQLLLVHSITSRGPPTGTAVL